MRNTEHRVPSVYTIPLRNVSGEDVMDEDKESGDEDQAAGSRKTMTVPEMIGKEVSVINHALNTSPVHDEYNNFSLFMNILGIALYMFDYCSDMLVVYWLEEEGEYTATFRRWTLAFVLVPLILVNIFSLAWHHQDHIEHEGGFQPRRHRLAGRRRLCLVLAHVLCLGPVVRQIQILLYGRKEQQHEHHRAHKHVEGPYCVNTNLKSANHYLQLYMTRKYYERDLAYLSLLDSFIQDAPQLVLQMYILLTRHPDDLEHIQTALAQLLSVAMSMISMSGALVSYAQASRWADPNVPQMTPLAVGVQWMWRFFIVSGRVFVICIFLTVFPREFFIFIGCHYALMLIWLISMRSNFCGSIDGVRRPVPELVYNVVMAFVLIFDVVSVTGGPTRLKHAAYYTLFALEQGGLMAAWFIKTSRDNEHLDGQTLVPWSHNIKYQVASLSLVPVCFLTGLIFLAIYFRRLHPAGRMPDWSKQAHLL